METIIKDLPLPKEVLEVQEALPLPEPEPEGIGVGTGIGIAALVLILVAAFAKYKCKCKKYWHLIIHHFQKVRKAPCGHF